MALFRVGQLPGEAVAAAARFHAEVLPELLAKLDGEHACLTFVFAPADHTHRAWRVAVVQGLAREHAPCRVNAVEGDDEVAIAATAAYLGRADGVTGQLLPLDSTGAGEVISEAR